MSALGNDLIRVCRDHLVEVRVRWTDNGNPVYWTCPTCGIRDERETQKVSPSELTTDEDGHRVVSNQDDAGVGL